VNAVTVTASFMLRLTGVTLWFDSCSKTCVRSKLQFTLSP